MYYTIDTMDGSTKKAYKKCKNLKNFCCRVFTPLMSMCTRDQALSMPCSILLSVVCSVLVLRCLFSLFTQTRCFFFFFCFVERANLLHFYATERVVEKF